MSIVAHFMANAAAHGLRVPAPPSLGLGGALSQTAAYRHVAAMQRQRKARIDALTRGHTAAASALYGMRLDAARTDRAVAAKELALQAEWAEHFASLEDGAGGGQRVRTDALVPMASQALTTFYSEVYNIQHMDLPAWMGDVLRIDRRVDPAANEYVWYERDLVGVARAASTYDHTSIPMVAGPAAQANRGSIVPVLVGMEVNFMDSRREALARENGKPDFQVEQGKRDACERSIAEFVNALWMYGDTTLGIDGLFNHPDISTFTVLGSWASKTALQIYDDLQGMFNAIKNRTGGQLGDGRRLKIVLPPAAFQRLTIPITAAGDKSVLAYFIEANRSAGATESTVVEQHAFASANSAIYNGGPLGLAADTGLIVYDQGNDNNDAMFVLSQDIETPAPARETGLGSVVYYHARAGGLRIPDARTILYAIGM